jgi:hypothetical protein
MNDKLSDELLLACGLLYYHGEQLRVSTNGWQSLLSEFRLDDVEVPVLTHTQLIGARVNVIWIGAFRIDAFGDKDSFNAGDQAVRIQNGTLKMKRLQINSQQNDFRSFIIL